MFSVPSSKLETLIVWTVPFLGWGGHHVLFVCWEAYLTDSQLMPWYFTPALGHCCCLLPFDMTQRRGTFSRWFEMNLLINESVYDLVSLWILHHGLQSHRFNTTICNAARQNIQSSGLPIIDLSFLPSSFSSRRNGEDSALCPRSPPDPGRYWKVENKKGKGWKGCCNFMGLNRCKRKSHANKGELKKRLTYWTTFADFSISHSSTW